jgi:hypothetical protein
MILCRLGVLALALPAALVAQSATNAPVARAVAVPPATPSAAYRGFAPGVPYKDFVQRARALAVRDRLVCNTAKRTAQVMECGVAIRDPSDSARFYLSASVIDGSVAMLSFHDSGGPGLVDRLRAELTTTLGPGSRIGRSTLEWVYGRKVVRFSWRGRGKARWIYVSLEDRDVTDRISKYVQRRR